MSIEIFATAPWIAAVVVLPLFAAVTALALGPRDMKPLLAVALPAIVIAVVALALQLVATGPVRHAVGGWGAPLGIELHADGLSTVMLLMSATVGTVVSLYALSYFAAVPDQARWFWPLWLFLWAALNALFASADVFNLYVTLELVTLAAVPLVALAGGAAVAASLRYLLAAVLASLLYLLGVALLYGAASTLDIAQLGATLAPGPAVWTAIALITVALLLKSGLFPLHHWLPPAHAQAPAPVSALLSALVVKASFYLLARLWFKAFPAALVAQAGTLLGALAAGAIVWGSWQALRAQRLKLLIAWSTVAQLGYLFLLFPLAESAAARELAWQGAIYQTVSHAFAKASLFLAAGAVLRSLGHDRLEGLDGMAQHFPLALLSIGIAGMSLMGLPPSGGFVAKWLLLRAALAGGQWHWALLIVGGGLAAAGYMFRIVRPAFVPRAAAAHWRPVPRALELAALALALAALLLGFASDAVLALLAPARPEGA